MGRSWLAVQRSISPIRGDRPLRGAGVPDHVIEVPIELAPSRGLAIAAALTQIIRSGEEPGEVLGVSRSDDGWNWLVRVDVEPK
jgi:hypothetical protein